MKQLIVVIFDASDETYGHRRVHAALLRSGYACSVELVRALMRELGLVPCQPAVALRNAAARRVLPGCEW